jgi:hypothetical protein
MAVFQVVAPCGLVEVYQRFRGPCRLHHHAPIMEAARTSETLVNFYQTTRRNNPEDSHLQMNPLHILAPYLRHISKLSSYLGLELPRRRVPSTFSHRNCVCISHSLHTCYMPRPSHYLNSIW